MQGLNKAILIGTVDDAPRLHQSVGRARLTLKLLTTEKYRDENGAERERRSWHTVVVWGRRAEALAPLLTRGRRLAIEGRIANGSWEGSDGRRRYRTEIHAHEVVLLDRSPGAPAAEAEDRDAA
jgi:single-strand DNA-binding protein